MTRMCARASWVRGALFAGDEPVEALEPERLAHVLRRRHRAHLRIRKGFGLINSVNKEVSGKAN